jgi:hypothetical protein
MNFKLDANNSEPRQFDLVPQLNSSRGKFFGLIFLHRCNEDLPLSNNLFNLRCKYMSVLSCFGVWAAEVDW